MLPAGRMLHYAAGRCQVVAMAFRLQRAISVIAALVLAAAASPPRHTAAQLTVQSAPFPGAARLQAVRQYIKGSWGLLTRSVRDLPRAAPDPKMRRDADQPWPVYIAADENRETIEQSLRTALAADELRRIDLR